MPEPRPDPSDPLDDRISVRSWPDHDERSFWGEAPPRRGPRRASSRQRGVQHRPLGHAVDTARARVAERVAGWRDDARLGVAVLVVVAVVAGVVWYRVGMRSAAPAASAAPATTARESRDGAAPSTSRAVAAGAGGATTRTTVVASIVVHVAGSVVRPGVVEVVAGARIVDALRAAGGPTPEADLDRLNLAAPVADGERVFVAKVGQVDPAGAAGTTAGGAGAGSGAAPGAVPSGPLNLNSATAAQLETLPGIGPALAQAILAERQRRGRFTSVNELRSVRGIGEVRFADLKDLVTV